jgi:hypothetical protein
VRRLDEGEGEARVKEEGERMREGCRERKGDLCEGGSLA